VADGDDVMITVRFPNGQALIYNTADYINRRAEFTEFYTHKGGNFLGQAPNSCVIEFVAPCRIYNALQESSLETLTKEVRALRRKIERKRK
jgi:hypothetical protein